jgi:hypothetical protein
MQTQSSVSSLKTKYDYFFHFFYSAFHTSHLIPLIFSTSSQNGWWKGVNSRTKEVGFFRIADCEPVEPNDSQFIDDADLAEEEFVQQAPSFELMKQLREMFPDLNDVQLSEALLLNQNDVAMAADFLLRLEERANVHF